MAENKRARQAIALQQHLTTVGAARTWTARDRKTLAAFASWVYKVEDHPELGAGEAPHGGFLDYRAGLPRPPSGQGGYDGAAFLHKESGTLILANRGSETLEDWLRNAQAALGFFWKQVGPAVTFAADSVIAAERLLGGPVARVECTGNSLGGALAEAQVALLRAELKARGADAPSDISGLANASAAFGHAITDYGARYTGLPNDVFALAARMKHIIRTHDPILAQHRFPRAALLGAPDHDIANIYVVNLKVPKPASGHGFGVARWELEADATNHNDFAYFQYLHYPAAMHLVQTKARGLVPENTSEPEKLIYQIGKLPEKYS